jgi:hypothetical protein
MTFRVACIADFDGSSLEFTIAALTLGRFPLVPQRGAVYRVKRVFVESDGEFLALVEEPSVLGYRSVWFRPVVEGEAELERLRAIAAGVPAAAPAPARELELFEEVSGTIPRGASGTAREAPSSALQAAPPLSGSSRASRRDPSSGASRHLLPQGEKGGNGGGR